MKISLRPSVAVFTLAGALVSQAATIPFSNDFSSTGLATNSGFVLGGGFQTLTATGDVDGTPNPIPIGVSTSQFSNAANSSITVTSRFSINSLGNAGGSDQSVGLALFGFNSTLTGTSDATRYIFADWRFLGANAGRLRLFEIDGSNVTLAETAVGNADTNGGTAGVVTAGSTLFTLQATITNTATNTYDISLGLFDAAGTTQFGASASVTGYLAGAEPSGGYHFGIRSRLPNTEGTTTAAFGDFNVVPEPSTGAFLGLGVLSLLASRRRKTA